MSGNDQEFGLAYLAFQFFLGFQLNPVILWSDFLFNILFFVFRLQCIKGNSFFIEDILKPHKTYMRPENTFGKTEK